MSTDFCFGEIDVDCDECLLPEQWEKLHTRIAELEMQLHEAHDEIMQLRLGCKGCWED